MKRLLVILAVAASAFADHPTKERGFRADSLYQFNDLDTINLYNGNVNIMLPLGSAYPVSSNLSYSIMLRYAGNVWSELEVCGGKSGEACKVHYLPRRDNAGFGWHLTLGELIPAGTNGPFWKLRTADGSEHSFLNTLHPEDFNVTGFRYTRDGTYLRMKEPTATSKLIEFPNGLRQLYVLDTTHNEWQLRYIYDTFSAVDANAVPTTNFASITYTYTADNLGILQWTISDTTGRTHYVYFRSAASTLTPRVIDRVDLQAFGGVRAVYDFGYNQVTDNGVAAMADGAPRAISRPCRFTDDSASVATHLLTKLRLTKGNPSSPTEPFTSFTMQYDEGIVGGCSPTSGLMTSMTVPTLARYQWIYRAYNFAGTAPYDESVGVSERLVYNEGGKLVQLRHYDAAASGTNIVRTMKVPGGSTSEAGATVDSKSVHYFTFDNASYDGLPFTFNTTDGTSPARYLSTEVFDCNEASATEACNATPERRQYLRYDLDTQDLDCGADPACFRDRNRRVATDRVQYTTDGGKTADTNRANFDGLGHYRSTATAGTFAAGNIRSETINYNDDMGDYPGVTYVPMPPTNRWLLETYTDKTTTEGASTSVSQYCFNATSGALERVRTQAGTTVGANDLLSVFLYDASGNVSGERYYGGDGQTISTGTALCSLALPASIPFRLAHTYQYGARKSSEYQTGSGASVLKFADYDIDPSTGWILNARDSAGFATAFEFDALGRLTWELPASGGDAYTEYVYTPAASSAVVAKATINKRPNNSRTGTPLARSEYKFDGLGRLWQARTLMANNHWNLRETGYDWAGRKAYETVTGEDDGSVLPRTSYAYDIFGRLSTATSPDGDTITTAYTGVRQISRTGTVKSTAPAEIPTTTTEIYDRQGRLYQVLEPSRPDSTNATTTYTYNSQNNLTGVSIAGQEGTQSRAFSYDGRGFLLSESHPENGITSYSHDARGHVTRRVNGGIDMRTLYDTAERPSIMYEASGAVWKQFTYSSANTVDTLGQVSWSKGKMTQAQRHNPFPEYLQDIVITEGYTYGGRNGRMSRRDTTSSDGAAFTQSFTYNELGSMASQAYPSCTAKCTGSGITVTYNYGNGFLTSIPGYAGTISYHPDGRVYQATYGSGTMKWTQEKDPDGMPRPGSIALTGPGSTMPVLWTSGAYQYDGVGNIFGIGTDSYAYDKVNRVIGATIAGSTQNATYDSFGNLKSFATNGASRMTPTSGLTNRLASITDAGTTTSVVYDTRGNVTSLRGNTFDYDALGMPRLAGGPTRNWAYIYTPGEERIWAYDLAATRSTWTLRGLDNKPLAEWVDDGLGWTGPVNYIYRDGFLHASYSSARVPSTMYYAVDHLGTPRKIVDPSGNTIGTHTYYPFGQEQTNSLQDTQRLKFTSHERDFCCDGTNDSIDFMHARQYSSWGGRFLSVDPGKDWDLHQPQSWNMYAYVQNNPMSRTDPTGKWGWDDVKQWWSRTTMGYFAYNGAAMANDARVRQQYVAKVSTLSKTDTVARTAAKTTARAESSPTGAAMAEQMRPISGEAARAAGTASKTNAEVNAGMATAGKVGNAMLVVGVTMSVVRVATAPEGQVARTGAQESGAWAGALSFGAVGAKGGAAIGTFIEPGGGTVVGGFLGGVGGGILGAFLGEKAGNNIYDAAVPEQR